MSRKHYKLIGPNNVSPTFYCIGVGAGPAGPAFAGPLLGSPIGTDSYNYNTAVASYCLTFCQTTFDVVLRPCIGHV